MDRARTRAPIGRDRTLKIARRGVGVLAGKVAIVTGGGSGIGAATARRFAAEGASVALWGRNEDRGAQVAGEIGPAAIFVRCDVSDEAAVRTAIERTVEVFGTVDILVNNGGAAPRPSPIEELEEAEWDRILGSHLKGTFLCSKHVVPLMKARRRGAIANACSTAGLQGSNGIQAYNAAKHGIAGLTKALAIELGPHGIRVNAVAPGLIDTPMLRRGAPALSPEVEALAKTIPLGFVARPEDVAAANLFLVSDESRFVTGAILSVDGGVVAS